MFRVILLRTPILPAQLLESAFLPDPVRIPQHVDHNGAVLYKLDCRENTFNVLPEDDIVPIDMIGGNIFDSCCASNSERLILFHGSLMQRRGFGVCEKK